MTDNVYRPILTGLFAIQVSATVGLAMILSAVVPAMPSGFGGTQMMAQQAVGYGVQQSPGVPMVPLALIIPSAGIPAVTNGDATPQAMPPPAVAAPDDSAPEPAVPEAADEAARRDELSGNPQAASTQLAAKAP